MYHVFPNTIVLAGMALAVISSFFMVIGADEEEEESLATVKEAQ